MLKVGDIVSSVNGQIQVLFVSNNNVVGLLNGLQTIAMQVNSIQSTNKGWAT